MDKKRLKEIKEMSDNARKSMAGELESIKKQQENLMKLKLVIEAVGELLKDNPDFRKQFDSKLAELKAAREIGDNTRW